MEAGLEIENVGSHGHALASFLWNSLDLHLRECRGSAFGELCRKERCWVWFCWKKRFYPCTIALVFCFSFRILSGLIERTKGEREGKSSWFEKGEYIYLIKRNKSDLKFLKNNNNANVENCGEVRGFSYIYIWAKLMYSILGAIPKVPFLDLSHVYKKIQLSKRRYKELPSLFFIIFFFPTFFHLFPHMRENQITSNTFTLIFPRNKQISNKNFG